MLLNVESANPERNIYKFINGTKIPSPRKMYVTDNLGASIQLEILDLATLCMNKWS